ncbi:hypothetical protein ACFZDI_29430 [Streptomyces sp. NPDC007907]|uniref:hypothetical protein n=1 Tax=Streptomyces sp. NPDC007907 TaxID=3364789 RepID=UPI0036DFD135
MSRRRPAVREDGMPDWLAEYRPELWAEDLDDPLQVYYFGRCDWQAAREEWQQGGDPQPKIESPRPVQRGSVNTLPVPEQAGRPPSPQVNRAKSVPQARPIRTR